jgi:preprotein translocase subunit SecE
LPETKPTDSREEEPLEAPPPAPPEELSPALTLKGAGGMPALDRLGPWFGNTRLFLEEVYAEFKKISWPTRQQITVETIVVIVISAFLTFLVMGYDWIFTFMANKVFYGQ